MADKRTPVTPRTTASARTPVRETAAAKQKPRLPLFEKDNYIWMAIGAVVIAIGMFVMSGGKNENPNQFDYKQVYSTARITVAPILILAGFIIEIYAIFKRPKAQHQ